MEVIKVEIERSYNPEYKCPHTGKDLLSEEFHDAIREGSLMLAVAWEDPDEYVDGDGELMFQYQEFVKKDGEYDSYKNDEDPTERFVRFLKEHNLENNFIVHEVTVNAMACGPITETNIFVFPKEFKSS